MLRQTTSDVRDLMHQILTDPMPLFAHRHIGDKADWAAVVHLLQLRRNVQRNETELFSGFPVI